MDPLKFHLEKRAGGSASAIEIELGMQVYGFITNILRSADSAGVSVSEQTRLGGLLFEITGHTESFKTETQFQIALIKEADSRRRRSHPQEQDQFRTMLVRLRDETEAQAIYYLGTTREHLDSVLGRDVVNRKLKYDREKRQALRKEAKRQQVNLAGNLRRFMNSYLAKPGTPLENKAEFECEIWRTNEFVDFLNKQWVESTRQAEAIEKSQTTSISSQEYIIEGYEVQWDHFMRLPSNSPRTFPR